MKKLFVGQKQRICMRVFWPITAANSAPGIGGVTPTCCSRQPRVINNIASGSMQCIYIMYVGRQSVYYIELAVYAVWTSQLSLWFFDYLWKSMIISRFVFSTLSYIMMMLGYPKDFRQRVAKHIHFYCISIFFILSVVYAACLLSDLSGIGEEVVGATNFFTVQVFNNFLHTYFRPKSSPAKPPTLLCTYFISLTPPLPVLYLFHSVLSHLSLCFSYFSASSSSSSHPQHFTIPL